MILTFSAAGEDFGVDAGHVREVGTPERYIRVPGTPEHIRGITRHAGRLMPIIDLRIKFGAAGEPAGKRAGVIYVDFDGAYAGLVADRIGGLIPEAEADEAIRLITAEDIG
jgi:purine-binding chemotaxis protein CheW